MKVNILLLLFGLFFGTMAMAQVKIGDNPQNIGAASVLELESSTRALVITRVSTVQMNAIVPLEGAMVYNTDAQCIYYYNGAEWLNLCDALNNSISISLTDNGDGTYTFTDAQDNTTEILVRNQSLVVEDGNLILTEGDGNQLTVALNSLNTFNYTTLPIQYPNSPPNTVVITPDETGTIYNFEMGLITGENIQDGTITQDNLGANSVSRSELAENAVDSTEINNDAVTAAKINVDVAGSGLRQAANGSLEVDIANIEGAGDLTASNGAIVIAGTPDDALLADVSLGVMVDSTTIGIDPATGLEVMDNGITNVQMADLSIGTDELINDAVTTAKIAPNTITAEDIATNAVASDEIAADAVTLPKLANGTTDGQIMQWDGTLNEWVLITLADQTVTEVDGVIGNEVVGVTAGNTSLALDGTGSTTDQYTLRVADEGIGTDELATDAVTSDKIDDETIVNIDVAGNAAIAGSKINPNFVDQNIITTGTLQAGSTTINYNTAESYTLPAINGDPGQVLSSDGAGATAWSTINTIPELLDAQIIVANGTTPSAVAMSGDATILNTGAVTIANDAITSDKIDDETIVNIDVAGNAAIAGSKINPNFVDQNIITTGTLQAGSTTINYNTAESYTLPAINGDPGQVLSSDGAGATAWSTINTIPELLDAQIIVANGTTPSAVAMSGDATILNTGAVTIVNDAVTSDKIDDGTIANIDVADDAEIAGTKIDPDFGNQAVITTGTLAAANTTIGGTLDITGVTTINATTAEFFALPAVNGDPGQVLSTDGIGGTSWATIPTVVAAGKVAANGIALKIHEANITYDPLIPGAYGVLFNSPRNDENYIIQLTLLGVAAGTTIQVTGQTINDFTVQILDAAGTSVDAAWYFTVTDF